MTHSSSSATTSLYTSKYACAKCFYLAKHQYFQRSTYVHAQTNNTETSTEYTHDTYLMCLIHTTLTSLKSLNFSSVFWRNLVRIRAAKSSKVTEASHGFPQLLQANSETVARIMPPPITSTGFRRVRKIAKSNY